MQNSAIVTNRNYRHVTGSNCNSLIDTCQVPVPVKSFHEPSFIFSIPARRLINHADVKLCYCPIKRKHSVSKPINL